MCDLHRTVYARIELSCVEYFNSISGKLYVKVPAVYFGILCGQTKLAPPAFWPNQTETLILWSDEYQDVEVGTISCCKIV